MILENNGEHREIEIIAIDPYNDPYNDLTCAMIRTSDIINESTVRGAHSPGESHLLHRIHLEVNVVKLKFNKSTDTEHEIKLESTLISAMWAKGVVFAGRKAKASVQTSMVGEGAQIQLTARDQDGSKIDKITGNVSGNNFSGEFTIPENVKLDSRVYFEVKLPKHGLCGRSNVVPVRLAPKLKSMKWSAKEARRGDVVTLTAEVENVRDHTEAILTIYEYDADGTHDRIVELPANVENGKISCDWEYEYHEDTDEIPTQEEQEKYGGEYNPPEYFFTVKVQDAEFGKDQESDLLEFKDWVEIEIHVPGGQPLANAKYVLHLADGRERRGTLDDSGHAKEVDIAPGMTRVEFPNLAEAVAQATAVSGQGKRREEAAANEDYDNQE